MASYHSTQLPNVPAALDPHVDETVIFRGENMLPLLRDGDELRVERANLEELAVGDVVAYRVLDECYALRVLYKGKNKLGLCADRLPKRKFVTWREFVIGRVTARARNGKTLYASAPAWKFQTAAALSAQFARQAPTRLKRKFKRSAISYAQPLNVQLNLSATCNLKCRMCPYLEIHTSDRLKFMARETLAAMLPTIRQIGRVHFSGSGEPLFHREIFEFIARVRQEVPQCVIDLTTNGTMLTRERAARILDLRVDKLHVSFDGLPGRVETVRRNVNGIKVMDNLRAFVEMKHARGVSLPFVQINYMTGYGTYHDLIAFIQLAREVGINEIQLLEMQPATAADVEHNLLNDSRVDQGYALKTALMLADQSDIRLYPPLTHSNACHFPSNPHIAEDGEAFPCCYLDYNGRQLYEDGREYIFPAFPLGNVNARSFDEIWHDPRYIAFRERNARGDFDAICRVCYNSRQRTSQYLRELLELPQ